jgi:hypothetical protein
MNASIPAQIARFKAMSVGQLRVEWERLYGEPTRTRNRDYLWKRLAWRIQELQFGGLSDTAKARIAEINEDNPVVRRQLPRGFAASLERTPGPRRDPRLPASGATLVRKYKGEDVRVLVHDRAYEWSGRRFDSLSEVAFAVTGSRWNGLLFFGLTARKRKS